MKNILTILVLFFIVVSAYADTTINQKYQTYSEYKKVYYDFKEHEYKLKNSDTFWREKELKYTNKWIKMPYIENKMVIDDVFIPEIIDTLKRDVQDKDVYIGLVHLRAFKIMPKHKDDIGKYIKYKATITKTLKNIKGIGSKGYEITFTLLISSHAILIPEMFPSETIVVLKQIDNVLYIDPFLTFSPNKKLMSALLSSQKNRTKGSHGK